MFTSAEVRPGVLAKASHRATNEAGSQARRRSAQDLATGQAVALQSEPPTSAADLAAAGQRRHDAAPGGRRRPATCCAARPARIYGEAAQRGAAGQASAQSCRASAPPRPPWRPLVSRPEVRAWWTAQAGNLAQNEAGADFRAGTKKGRKTRP